jgi:hypothetical protein
MAEETMSNNATTDFSIILAKDDRLPDGEKQIDATVYLHDSEIVVLGYPSDLDQPEEQHSCDLLGCGSIGPHVLARVGLELCGPEQLEAAQGVKAIFKQAIEDHKEWLPTPRTGLIEAIKQVQPALNRSAPTPGYCVLARDAVQMLHKAAKRYFGTDFST